MDKRGDVYVECELGSRVKDCALTQATADTVSYIGVLNSKKRSDFDKFVSNS